MNAALGVVTGRYAGPVSRLAAFAVDALVVVALYGVFVNVVVFAMRLVLSVDIETDGAGGNWWTAAYIGWSVLYYWASLAITGRTVGKWVAGLRVVQRDGTPLRAGPALVRVVALPLSLGLVGLGLLGIVLGRERRALHDVIAGSVVVYDWGDRPAEMPAPLTRWLERRGAMAPPAAADPEPTSIPPPDAT